MTTTTNNKEPSQVAVTAMISTELSKHLHDLAAIKSVDITQLASRYIEERIEQDLPLLRKKHYFDHLIKVLHEHNVPKGTIETLEDNFLY